MSATTKIEWATKTWNPLRGCSKVSEGCRNCYAIRYAYRFSGPGKPFEGLTEKTAAGLNWTGKIRLVPEALDEPLKWRKPKRVFVNSMSDLFHENVPDEYIDKVFAVMALAEHHTFQILTKRPERMLKYLTTNNRRSYWAHEANRMKLSKKHVYIDRTPNPLPNVWLGVSVENQRAADERIPLLLQTPAAVRFLSCEPLLGPVNLTEINVPITGPGSTQPYAPPTGRRINTMTGDVLEYDWHGRGVIRQGARIDWVIVGSESGPNRRECDIEWVRSLRDQCKTAGVPFFYKQKVVNGKKIPLPELDGRTWDEYPV